MAHARTYSIEAAIRKAKKRDRYKCIICGRGHETGNTVDGSHLFVRNCSYPRYHADDPDHIFTACSWHHAEYGKQTTWQAKAAWFRKYRLEAWAHLVEYIVGEREAC